jgi:predicted dehydrogenase
MELSDPEGTGYLGEMQEFLACIAEDRPPVTAAEDGKRDLEIILACYASLSKGQPQPI